ncbi:MAG: transposase [Oligoflexus sp.]|nr:transposase [Oligoflexus sp.]
MKNSFDPHFWLKSLKADFASFRAKNRPHARYPDQLRSAAIEAVATGIKLSLMARALNVSPTLLQQWQRRVLLPVPTEDCPRILNVLPPNSNTSVPTGLRVSYEAGRLLLEISF